MKSLTVYYANAGLAVSSLKIIAHIELNDGGIDLPETLRFESLGKTLYPVCVSASAVRFPETCGGESGLLELYAMIGVYDLRPCPHETLFEMLRSGWFEGLCSGDYRLIACWQTDAKSGWPLVFRVERLPSHTLLISVREAKDKDAVGWCDNGQPRWVFVRK